MGNVNALKDCFLELLLMRQLAYCFKFDYKKGVVTDEDYYNNRTGTDGGTYGLIE